MLLDAMQAMKLAKPDLDSMLLEFLSQFRRIVDHFLSLLWCLLACMRQSMRDLKDTEELENLFRPYATQNAVRSSEHRCNFAPDGRACVDCACPLLHHEEGEEEISLADLQAFVWSGCRSAQD